MCVLALSEFVIYDHLWSDPHCALLDSSGWFNVMTTTLVYMSYNCMQVYSSTFSRRISDTCFVVKPFLYELTTLVMNTVPGPAFKLSVASQIMLIMWMSTEKMIPFSGESSDSVHTSLDTVTLTHSSAGTRSKPHLWLEGDFKCSAKHFLSSQFFLY